MREIEEIKRKIITFLKRADYERVWVWEEVIVRVEEKTGIPRVVGGDGRG
jgi:hypothetical protein